MMMPMKGGKGWPLQWPGPNLQGWNNWIGAKGNQKGGGSKPLKSIPDDFTFDSEARYVGTVSIYNKWKGFGFINLKEKGVVPEDRIFVHWRNIQSEDRFPFLSKDMEVEFGLMKWKERSGGSWKMVTTLRAKTVTEVGGKPIQLQDSLDAESKTFLGGQELRYTGKLKFYEPRGGFGYVAMDDGYSLEEGVPKELRVERTEVNAGGRQPVAMENVQVEFGIWKTKKEIFKVYNMTLPGGSPLTQDALEHREVDEQTQLQGKVEMWNFKQGWGFIKPDNEDVISVVIRQKLAEQMQSAKQRAEKKGRKAGEEKAEDEMLFYFRRGDLKQGGKLSKGDEVTFNAYSDDKGAGACNIVVHKAETAAETVAA